MLSLPLIPGLGRRKHLSDDNASDTHNAQRSSGYPFVYNFSLLFSPLEESRFQLLSEGGQRSPLTREAEARCASAVPRKARRQRLLCQGAVNGFPGSDSSHLIKASKMLGLT